MRRNILFYLLGPAFLFVLSGCVVRTYPVTKERVDQDLSFGNRGYLQGQSPNVEQRERRTTRTTQIVEVELYPPIKFERMPKVKESETAPMQKAEEQLTAGNRGYVFQANAPEIESADESFEKYTVKKGDTLQKISQRFYGTTKKWNRIYQANQDALKGPNKIYPGQMINIPLEPLKEDKRNLK